MSYCLGTPSRLGYYANLETGETRRHTSYGTAQDGWKYIPPDPAIGGCGYHTTHHVVEATEPRIEEDLLEPMFRKTAPVVWCSNCDRAGLAYPPPPGGTALC